MGVTISTHNGSSVAREHNVRNEKVVSKESHIDPNGVHEIWHDEKVRSAYERLFGQAQADYNAKQTRADRRIDNYYNEVCKDAKKHTCYEMIIGIYGTNENGTPLCSAEQGKAIMREFVENWRQRNPNLEMIGAYYHADEQGEPHVHIDYIPVAHGYERGMETQTGLVKALKEQGFEKQGKATAQIQWEARENAFLDQLCRQHGLEVEHPKEKNRKHVETETFKAQKELERTIDHVNGLDKHVAKQERKESRLKDDISRLKGERKELKDLQKEKAGKTILGTPRKSVTLPYEEYATLQRRARKIMDIESREQKSNEMFARAERRLEYATHQQATAEDYLNSAMDKEKEYRDLIKGQNQLIQEKAQEIAQDFVDHMKNDAGTFGSQITRMVNFLKKNTLSNGQNAMEAFKENEEEIDRWLVRAYEKSNWQIPEHLQKYQETEQVQTQGRSR